MNKTDKFQKDIELLKKHILPQEPEHFGTTDIIHAFFGAFVMGLTFFFKEFLIKSSIKLSWINIGVIIFTTIIIIIFEIYFIGYSRVKNKKKRRPIQFVAKRHIAVYLITITVSIFLANIFAIHTFAGGASNVFKIVFVLAMPCGIGAALADLFKKY